MSDTNIENQLRIAKNELNRRIAALEETLLEKGRTEAALQASERRYRRLFQSARDGILILDADTGKVVDVNPFLLQLLGYSYDAICGQHIWELGLFKDIAASKDAFKTLQDNEYIRYENLPLQTLDGRPIAVEFVSNVYLVDHTKVIQCNIRDITERDRAKEEKEKLQAQLFQAQKIESVVRLAGGVAHDFNNTLCVIIGRAELALQQDLSNDKLQNNLKEILKAGWRSADLTQQLLAFARKQTAVPKILDLNATISGMLNMLRRFIGEDIALSWQPGHDLWKVKIDPSQVDQMLSNLAVNARDAVSGVGAITIRAENVVVDDSNSAEASELIAGEYVLLTVSDTGAGMSQEVLDKIFDPFFTTKEVGKGPGLGLSTVYGIDKQNDGFIYVASEPGKGATFKIYLPRIEAETAEVPSKHVSVKRQTCTETILLVEDDEAVLDLSKIMLEKLGYTVLAAHSHVHAMHVVKEHPGDIHLLISDVVMPEMNGWELAELLRVIRPNLKCLYMSGYTADAIAHGGILDEGVNFIQKPFRSDDLAAKVRQVLGRLE